MTWSDAARKASAEARRRKAHGGGRVVGTIGRESMRMRPKTTPEHDAAAPAAARETPPAKPANPQPAKGNLERAAAAQRRGNAKPGTPKANQQPTRTNKPTHSKLPPTAPNP